MTANVVVELDSTCSDSHCATAGTYALTGVCGNCGRDARVTFTKGHATPDYASGPACWNCGCRDWSWKRGEEPRRRGGRRVAGAGVAE